MVQRIKDFKAKLKLMMLTLVFRQTFRIVAVGLAIGIGAAILAMHSLRAFLAGLESANPAYIWIASVLVASTAGVACWIPARRASRIDPISALRQE